MGEKWHPAPSSKNVGAVEQQRVTVENARKSFPERKRNLPALRIGLVARHRALQDRITGLSAPPREEQGRSLSNEAIPVRDFIERAIRINYSAFHNNRVRIVYDIGHNTEKFRHHVLTYRNVLRTSRTSYMPSRFSEKILKITRSRSSRPQYNPLLLVPSGRHPIGTMRPPIHTSQSVQFKPSFTLIPLRREARIKIDAIVEYAYHRAASFEGDFVAIAELNSSA